VRIWWQRATFSTPRSGEHCLTGPEDADISQRQMQCLVQTLQPGANLVAAGYILYSSSGEASTARFR
jgi:hypothetical protein